MSFMKSDNHEDTNQIRSFLNGCPPLITTLQPDMKTVKVLFGGKNFSPSEIITPILPHNTQLKDLIEKNNQKTYPNGILVFKSAFQKDNSSYVDNICIRTHDKMTDDIQFVYALAKPSNISFTKKGFSQWFTIADPSHATTITNALELKNATQQLIETTWPGGLPGFLFRHPSGTCKEVYLEKDTNELETPENFSHRIVTINEFLEDGPLEIIPIWSLPSGIEQCREEGLSSNDYTQSPIKGKFSSLYPDQSRERSFLPTVLLVGNEIEWAFGSPTKNVRKSVLKAWPISQNAYTRKTISTNPSKLIKMSYLWKTDEDVKNATKQRTGTTQPSNYSSTSEANSNQIPKPPIPINSSRRPTIKFDRSDEQIVKP